MSTAAKTILVVDDNPTNIQVLFDVLSAMEFEVAIAKSGESALQRLQLFQPDIILLDVMMPGIDGFQTCEQLKSNPQTCDIPVIFMTALSDPTDKVKGLSLGAVDYITKPIQHEEALARIRVHLQLHDAHQKLQQALGDLQQSQAHLVQSEKMSSLGQLVAGVAHEINNPMNFIYGNLNHARDYIQDLMNFVRLYQTCYPQPHPQITAWMEEVDLDYLLLDLPKVMDSMRMGSNRIRDLVLSLRNFSRLDEAEQKPVDIHDGIESTLLILQHRLRDSGTAPAIQLVKDYGELPPVECYPSQLNQVFMNLLVNAIDALEEAKTPDPMIKISTSLHHDTLNPDTLHPDTLHPENWVRIAIANNGPLIKEEIRSRLFDPFFTTKPIGKGTGLGLSISHQITTQKHSGKLECYCEAEMTVFVVQIPVRQPELSKVAQ